MFNPTPCENVTGCHANATCEPLPELGRAVCRCGDGLWGDGTDCYTPNPCLNASACDVNARCINHFNGSSSCECNEGYQAKGIIVLRGVIQEMRYYS